MRRASRRSPAGAIEEGEGQLAGRPERVGDRMAVVERDRGPQLAVGLGDEDVAARRVTRVQLGEDGERVGVAGARVADRDAGARAGTAWTGPASFLSMSVIRGMPSCSS